MIRSLLYTVIISWMAHPACLYIRRFSERF